MNNIEIQFNSDIIKKIKSLNLQVDQIGSILFILFALYEDQLELLDEFDDFNLQKRAILLYKELELRGFLVSNKNAEKKEPLYSLTREGVELVEYIKSNFAKDKKQLTSVDIAISGVETLTEAVQGNEVEHWISEWINIFPRGVKSGGKLVRSDEKSCLRKMKVFLREYDYNKDTIMEATKRYVQSKENEGYSFMRCAVYFIYRIGTSIADKSSDLASWCDEVLNGDSGNSHSENNLEIMV